MGEFYASNFEEFKKVVDVAVGASRKIMCVFGTTFHNTRECIERTKYAQDAGADGVMIGLPYLIPCTPEAAYEHYRLVNDIADDVQIMLYNNPGSFRFNIDVSLWDRLMQLDRVKAVKESNGDVTHRTRVMSHISKANQRLLRRERTGSWETRWSEQTASSASLLPGLRRRRDSSSMPA